MPTIFWLRSVARQWGVPPWEVTGEEPTRAVRSRWVWRERIFTSMEG